MSIQVPQRTRIFPKRCVDYQLARTSFIRDRMLVAALMRLVPTDIEAAFSLDDSQEGSPEIPEVSTLLIVERPS